jgi:hypothetical protein
MCSSTTFELEPLRFTGQCLSNSADCEHLYCWAATSPITTARPARIPVLTYFPLPRAAP